MDKVFVVTSGSYSDYGIDEVFADKEVAQSYVDARNSSCGGYEEFRLEEYELRREAPKHYLFYRISGKVDSQGNHSIEHESAYDEWHDDPPRAIQAAVYKTDATAYYPKGFSSGFATVRVWGLDPERVKKAYHDRVAEVRAEILGLT